MKNILYQIFTVLQIGVVIALVAFILAKLCMFVAWASLPACALYLIVKPFIRKANDSTPTRL